MLTIAKIFGKSPFAPLQTHMDKVASCVKKLPELFDALDNFDSEAIEEIGKKISKLEHEADLTKNDIRNHLPKSLFLPIDRTNLLEILSVQDALADKAEDIAIILTMRSLDHYKDFKDDFTIFRNKNIEVFWLVHQVTKQLDELIEASFGGVEAEKVKTMIEKIARQEHEIDLIQYQLLKKLYSFGEELSYVSFHLWITLFKEIAALSNLSEKLGNRIRMLLELK